MYIDAIHKYKGFNYVLRKLDKKVWSNKADSFNNLLSLGGQYLIVYKQHCIGIDFAAKLIFDCINKYAINLTTDYMSNISIDEIRIVVRLV